MKTLQRYMTIVFLITMAGTLLAGCVGPADYAMILRGEPKSYTDYGDLKLEVEGINPIDAAEELGKSLGFKIVRSNRYAVVLTSDVGSFWGLSGQSSLTGEVRTVIIVVSTTPYPGQTLGAENKQVSIQVTVMSNAVESRKEAERILAEFKEKLMNKIKRKI